MSDSTSQTNLPDSELPQPDWKWKSFSGEEYRKALTSGVHFSIKAVNSNAKPPLGIRIGSKSGKKLPYVCLVRAIADGAVFPLDYHIMTPPTIASIFKNSANIMHWDESVAIHQDAPREEVESVRNAVEKANQSDLIAEVEGEPISARARQVLFPSKDGDYFAVIPLPAAVFSGYMIERMKSYRESTSEQGSKLVRYPQRAFLGYGGANPQNVARYIRRMQTPLVFHGPAEDRNIKRAFSLYYNGTSLRLSDADLLEYQMWRDRNLDGDGVSSNMSLRTQESRLVGKIAAKLIARGRSDLQFLKEYRDVLPANSAADEGVGPDADPVCRGLLDPQCRRRSWLRDFSQSIARKIGQSMGLSSPAINQISRWIEDEVRTRATL